jgi:hypothetical protein
MLHGKPQRYLLSCGLLLLPIFIWNAFFMPYLPAGYSPPEFWRDIPAPLANAENVFRLLISALPFFMPLNLASVMQRHGLIVYCIGIGLYFASWLAVLLAPDSGWATSASGFLAPAYTPLIWLLGLAMLGQRLYWGNFYRWWMYLVPASVSMAAHISHAVLVHSRLH